MVQVGLFPSPKKYSDFLTMADMGFVAVTKHPTHCVLTRRVKWILAHFINGLLSAAGLGPRKTATPTRRDEMLQKDP